MRILCSGETEGTEVLGGGELKVSDMSPNQTLGADTVMRRRDIWC